MSDLKKMLHVVASRATGLDLLMDNGIRWTTRMHKAGLVRPDMRILDLGAGLGRLSIPLQAMGCEVLAVDARQDMVDHLQRAGIDARRCVGVPDEAADDSFDLVLAMHVFQHQGRQHVERLVQRISCVSLRLLFTLPTVQAYKGALPHDYVISEGEEEHFVDCEKSFTWQESRVPTLFENTRYTSCTRTGTDMKLWLAKR